VAVIWLSGERRRRGVTAIVLATLALTVFLALLGRYTPGATSPAVTLGNLLGGMTLLALLWLLRLMLAAPALPPVSRALAGSARLALLLMAAQIALGALVSAKYAALACATFPDCNGAWWPAQWSWAAFDPLRSFEGVRGDVAQAMRRTLHIAHRWGTVVVACSIALLAAGMWRRGGALRAPGTVLAGLLLLQIALGVALIVAQQPQLALSVAHDAVAALLLALVQLTCCLRVASASVSSAPRVRRA
jgi:cytochrome c oxidase assembly protein subunit 15